MEDTKEGHILKTEQFIVFVYANTQMGFHRE